MKNNKKCKNKYKQILIAVFSVIIICVVVLGAGYMYIRANIYKKTEPLTSEHLQAPVKTKEETIGYTEVEGITNVLLVGVDGIDFDEKYQRSDSMIIATLDSNKEKVKLTSLYRDTLVYIPGYGEEKMNLAFSLGGPELVMETIKYNFDVNITIIWLIYPLYLCGDYFIKIHGKYLIYEEKVNTEIEKNDIIDEAVC